jgi:hypothetical protein
MNLSITQDLRDSGSCQNGCRKIRARGWQHGLASSSPAANKRCPTISIPLR